jgi:hypothetical protein
VNAGWPQDLAGLLHRVEVREFAIAVGTVAVAGVDELRSGGKHFFLDRVHVRHPDPEVLDAVTMDVGPFVVERALAGRID